LIAAIFGGDGKVTRPVYCVIFSNFFSVNFGR